MFSRWWGSALGPEPWRPWVAFPFRAVYDALDRAGAKGLVISPPTEITREDTFMADGTRACMGAHVFTLQWHLTQRCDLACRHCYDRTDRQELPLERSLGILDDFGRFCETKHVRGAVTFTGGNPFLYPRFAALYKAAVDRGFAVAILGNPTDEPFSRNFSMARNPISSR